VTVADDQTRGVTEQEAAVLKTALPGGSYIDVDAFSDDDWWQEAINDVIAALRAHGWTVTPPKGSST